MGEFLTYLILALSGMIVGYWLTYRDRSQEESARGRLKQENRDLRRSLQTSQVAVDSLEEKFGRQRGQLNVLQQLCDDWSSSREIAERERAQLESDIAAKSTRVSEVEAEYRDEKQKRIELEDRIHQLTQEAIEKTAELEVQWRSKHSESESALNKSLVDIVSVRADNEKVTDQLHSAKARIAELESEIETNKEMVETAAANATGLKQEYVTLETSMKNANDQLKQVRAEVAMAVSQKEAADKAVADSEKRLAVSEQDCKKLDELNCKLQQKLEMTQSTLTATQEQLAKVTEQRDQSLESEKAVGVVASGLQKRIDNQESTIHMLRQRQDDALENLKHELKIRNEMEAKFDAKAEAIRNETSKVRDEYESQLAALRQGQEDALENLKHELKVRSEMEAKFDAKAEAIRNETSKVRDEYESQLAVLRQGQEDALENLKHELKVRNEMEAKFDARAEQLRIESEKMRQDYEAQLETLRKENEATSWDMKTTYEAQVEELRERLAVQQGELELERVRLTSESKSIVSRCTELETEASTYTESIVKLDAKREQLQHELETARKQLQSQLKQDSETIGELQRERNDLRAELEQLHAQMAQQQDAINSHTAFTTELDMSQTRIVELERSLAQRDQESKRLMAQANELERLRQRYQDSRGHQDKLQLQLDELVARQISSESDRSKLMARIGELEARLGASLETIADLRKERAVVLATLADQRQSQEPEATIISFTQSMASRQVAEEASYDEEYGGRLRRDANRGLVFMEAPESCDDLKRISGIAEVLEKRLNDFGIYTFKQVMEWRPEEIEEFSRLLAFRDRIERDDWQGQARFFYKQKRQGIRSAA